MSHHVLSVSPLFVSSLCQKYRPKKSNPMTTLVDRCSICYILLGIRLIESAHVLIVLWCRYYCTTNHAYLYHDGSFEIGTRRRHEVYSRYET